MRRRPFTTHCLNVSIFVVDKEECFLQWKINYAKVIAKVVNGPLCSRCCSGGSDAMLWFQSVMQ